MRSFIVQLFILSLAALAYVNCQTPVTQALDSGWTFIGQGNTTAYNATVPGSVHLDLLNNNLIPDPYLGDNVTAVQWVENITWIYSLTFNVSSSIYLNSDSVELVFEGLDTYANVTLNNKTIIYANNMWRRWVVNVKDLLQNTSNVLTVAFLPPPIYDDVKVKEFWPISLPSDTDIGRVFTRKAAYHFGWDWGPRLVTCGIWRPAFIQTWNNSRIDNVFYNQTLVTSAAAAFNLSLELFVVQNASYQVLVYNNDTNLTYYNQTQSLNASQSLTTLYAPFAIANPTLWWVRNYGDQYLYNITVQIILNGTVISQRTTKIGIRTIELVQERDADGNGTSFYFKINNISVFAKGGNYIPPDVFMTRVTTSTYESILGDAVAANYNFIRLWGGGNFEVDTFYDICDREGILLWHDFMFAGGMYPAYFTFLNNVKQEIIDNVKRIRNHASIALWCGNNEVKNGWEDWGYQNNKSQAVIDLIQGWYNTIFLNLIPSVLAEIDGTRAYWPSSPLWGPNHPQSLNEGDNHFYGVWGGGPIEDYFTNVGRFMSEYGMQGLLSMNSLKKFLQPQDIYWNSSVLQLHERGQDANKRLNFYMDTYYRPTKDFASFLYGTQIMQKLAIETAVTAHRTSKPRNMGTLVWQLNDDWPSFSWATRDYFGTWKAVHYMMREKYQNILVAVTRVGPQNKTTAYNVSIVSDKLINFNSTLNITIMDFNGTVLSSNNVSVSVANNSNNVYYSINASQLASYDLNRTLIWANISYPFDEQYSESIFYFDRPINLKLTYPNITTQFNVEAGTLSVTTNTTAIGVYYFVDGVDLNLNLNYFDLLPGQNKTIYAYNTNITNVTNIQQVLQVYNLYNATNQTTASTKQNVKSMALNAYDDEGFLSYAF